MNLGRRADHPGPILLVFVLDYGEILAGGELSGFAGILLLTLPELRDQLGIIVAAPGTQLATLLLLFLLLLLQFLVFFSGDDPPEHIVP
mmetsp:Transcript_9567/g.9199  ORF Transcript_9567/g.9199 Transcript_9567/m.9199 type:complete len:89 (+) Transcript_9567:2583-2849(+)